MRFWFPISRENAWTRVRSSYIEVENSGAIFFDISNVIVTILFSIYISFRLASSRGFSAAQRSLNFHYFRLDAWNVRKHWLQVCGSIVCCHCWYRCCCCFGFVAPPPRHSFVFLSLMLSPYVVFSIAIREINNDPHTPVFNEWTFLFVLERDSQPDEIMPARFRVC